MEDASRSTSKSISGPSSHTDESVNANGDKEVIQEEFPKTATLFQRHVASYLKAFVHSIAIIGVIMTLFNLNGYFTDKNRVNIYNQLLSKAYEYRVSFDTEGVNQFLSKYYYSKPIPADMRSQPIKGLLLTWVGMGNSQPMSGSVHVEFQNGKKTTSLCRLDELKSWSTETPFYGWLGWWLLTVSVVSRIAIDILEFREKKAKARNP